MNNKVENEINLIEYKFKELSFNNDEILFEELKPCYIDNNNKIIYSIQIPCNKLFICKKILIKNETDINKLSNKSGLYWIVSNEPINHCFNSGNKIPENINNENKIIYNGTTCNIKTRIKEHILRNDEKGGNGTQSGISIDIIDDCFINKKVSHIKCLYGKNKKIPKYLKDNEVKKINNKSDIINNIYFSNNEKEIIKKNDIIYFKNGINIFSNKHKNYNWIIYYLEIDNHNIRDYIEIEWRKKYGIPILCSYSIGR
jgi:hypothetical protein